MHAAGVFEEDAALGGDGGGVAEEVLEDGGAAAVGVGALGDLGELEGIAEEDDGFGGGGDGEGGGERHLAGFVDDQDVELLVVAISGEAPRCSGDEVDVGVVLFPLRFARETLLVV